MVMAWLFLMYIHMTTTTNNKPIIIMDNKTHHSEAEASAHHCPKDPDPKFNPEVQPAAAGPAGTAQRAGLSSLIDMATVTLSGEEQNLQVLS